MAAAGNFFGIQEEPKADTYGMYRLLMKNGEMMWAASDLARALGYVNPEKAVRTHCKYPKSFRPSELDGLEINPNGMYFIPESDVHRLILKSHMPKAVEIQDWVVEKVLSSIRETGGNPRS
jgi:anti-repressor protein